MDKLNDRIADLEAKIVAQQNALTAQQKKMDSMSQIVYGRPQGYTKAFITLGNFSKLPATDAISYWARN